MNPPRRSRRIAAKNAANAADGNGGQGPAIVAAGTAEKTEEVPQSNVASTVKPSTSGNGGQHQAADSLNKLSTMRIGNGSGSKSGVSSGNSERTSNASAASSCALSSTLRHGSNNNVGESRTPATSKPKSTNDQTASSATRLKENAENVPVVSTLSSLFAWPSKAYQYFKPRKSLIMANSQLLRNVEADVCKFCAIQLQAGEGITLKECLHVFCKACLESAIGSQKEECQVKCPVDADENCGGYLRDGEVKELAPPALYQEYLDRSLVIAKKKMKYVFNCQTEGCSQWCEFEKGRKTFDCPQCQKTNCMECKAIHTGIDCKTFQALSKTGQLTKVKELMAKARTNGWEQFTSIVKASGDNGETAQQTDLLENIMAFECTICLSDVAPGEGIILHECFHMFCKECLINLVKHNDEPTVKCPYIDGNYSCVSYMEPREIKALVPQAIHEKHLQRSEKFGESSMVNSYHCKTPDCQGWCEYEAGATIFKCPRCNKNNCIPCKAIHDGSCEDYKNRLEQDKNNKLSEAAVEQLIKTGEYMRCPKCKIPVQKAAGCDWICCLACRTEICWATRGPRWGPKGFGDTSGGCRCNVNGKKCHPKCGNCH